MFHFFKSIRLSACFVAMLCFDGVLSQEIIANFVFETDRNYVKPTCVAITSLCENTKNKKNIIVIQDGSIDENIAQAIEKIGFMYNNTKVQVVKIPDSLRDDIDKINMTPWSQMVAVRLFYPDILSIYNSDEGFINKLIEKKPITHFMHIDSDAVVVRNIDKFYETCTAYLSPIQSTSLCYFMFPHNFNMPQCGYNHGGVSGGVMFFHINKLDQGKILNAHNTLSKSLEKEKKLLEPLYDLIEYCLDHKDQNYVIIELLQRTSEAYHQDSPEHNFLQSVCKFSDFYSLRKTLIYIRCIRKSNIQNAEDFRKKLKEKSTHKDITEEKVFYYFLRKCFYKQNLKKPTNDILKIAYDITEYCLNHKDQNDVIIELLKQKLEAYNKDSHEYKFLQSVCAFSEFYSLEHTLCYTELIHNSYFKNIAEVRDLLSEISTHQNITEEEVFSYLIWDCYWRHPAKYNFVPKYIIPELDNTKQVDYEYFTKMRRGATKYSDICQAELKSGRTDVWDDWKDIHILHYDGCFKPWTQEFWDLAQTDSNVMILLYVHAYYLNLIKDFIPGAKDGLEKVTGILHTSGLVDHNLSESPLCAISRVQNEYTELARKNCVRIYGHD